MGPSARRTVTRLTVGVVLACALATPARAADQIVWLQPLGAELPAEDVAMVKAALVGIYALDVRILPVKPLPQAAWYPPRRRWRAEKILEYLTSLQPAEGGFMLGLTAADISTTKGKVTDWGVLGLGNLGDGVGGTTAVISTFRCHKKAKSELHARQRLAKTAAHEIGHTLGLEHCPTVGCLMEDAQGQVTTSDREHDLCARCRGFLRDRGRKLPEPPSLPWE
jgi:archaemetzincin